MFSKKSILTMIALPALLVNLLLTMSFPANAENVVSRDECRADVDLQGKVDKNNATVTNYSLNPDCEYSATLAIYDVPQTPDTPRWIDTQKLIDYKTITVKPGETRSLTVDGKSVSCRIQSDLIRGRKILEPPFYSNLMDVEVYEIPGCGIVQKIAATQMPTSTPTPDMKKKGEARGVLAKTGNSEIIYAMIIAGAIFIISGMVLKKISK